MTNPAKSHCLPERLFEWRMEFDDPLQHVRDLISENDLVEMHHSQQIILRLKVRN